jgi:hypothetical protein
LRALLRQRRTFFVSLVWPSSRAASRRSFSRWTFSPSGTQAWRASAVFDARYRVSCLDLVIGEEGHFGWGVRHLFRGRLVCIATVLGWGLRGVLGFGCRVREVLRLLGGWIICVLLDACAVVA